jgi:hypothetical protein
MDSTTTSLSFNRYLPFAILYFFLNGVFLPLGVLWTQLLAPLFLFWLIRYPVFWKIKYFFILTIPLFIAHAIDGILDYGFYLKSWVLFFDTFIFGLALWQYLENCHSLRYVFRKLLIINAFLTVVALIFLRFPALRKHFWYDNAMSLSHITFYRLQMLTYEPSFYSTTFAPIVIYYLLKAVRKEVKPTWLYYALALIPLFLSLSFGVILSMALALGIVLVWDSRNIIFKKRNLQYFAGGIIVIGLVLGSMAIFWPDNVVFRRMSNVITGRDLSFNGRTFDSFKLSMQVVDKTSIWFGAGLGQTKIYALPIFDKFYNTTIFTVNDVGIPNALGDLYATLGLFAVILKLFLEFYFFYRTRVSSNYYRLVVFFFIFIYQFTGSFIMNIAEYAAWIIAFHPGLFPEFNKNKSPKSAHLEGPVHRQSYPI